MHDHLLKVRPIPNHLHRENQNVCEKCMSQFASSGSPLIDAVHEYIYVTRQLVGLLMEHLCIMFLSLVRSIKHQVDSIGEYLYMANEVMLIVAQFILIASMGIGMVVAALFPTLAGRKSAYEESLNQKERERVLVTRDEQLEDDQLVNEINNTDDPEEKRRKLEELLNLRLELERKDERRQEIYDNYRDKISEANGLYRDACDAHKDHRYEDYERLMNAGKNAEAETDRLFLQYHSV